MLGRVRMRESTVSRRERVRLRGWVMLDVVALAVGRRLREREMLAWSSRLEGRWPSWSRSFSDSSKSDEVSESDELMLRRVGRDLRPSSSSTWVSDEGRFDR
jgi:hypothetical protein